MNPFAALVFTIALSLVPASIQAEDEIENAIREKGLPDYLETLIENNTSLKNSMSSDIRIKFLGHLATLRSKKLRKR